MEHAYRKFRKYGGSVVIATQSINDLYENAVGRAIAENSASMYLLGQTEEAVESVKRSGRLALSESGFRMLQTVHTVQGVYSEIFIKSKTGMGIGRLIVGDFQKLLYSTDPNDIHAIAQFTKKNVGVPEAIKAVMHSRTQRQITLEKTS
jgi:conjugal transfer ATP-binding protein TraC